MFTGIIEAMGSVENIQRDGENLIFTIKSTLATDLSIGQSLSHNGVCLTITSISDCTYRVSAIAETLLKTSLNTLKVKDFVNLERAMLFSDRLDGHLVQGHVDCTAICTHIKAENGSHVFTFLHQSSVGITIEKGSICVNGVSLTVFNSEKDSFSVAIIPHTFARTSFQFLQEKDLVNIEFDVIGKYIARLMPKNN